MNNFKAFAYAPYPKFRLSAFCILILCLSACATTQNNYYYLPQGDEQQGIEIKQQEGIPFIISRGKVSNLGASIRKTDDNLLIIQLGCINISNAPYLWKTNSIVALTGMDEQSLSAAEFISSAEYSKRLNKRLNQRQFIAEVMNGAVALGAGLVGLSGAYIGQAAGLAHQALISPGIAKRVNHANALDAEMMTNVAGSIIQEHMLFPGRHSTGLLVMKYPPKSAYIRILANLEGDEHVFNFRQEDT
ncbi:MAG: hypothetical protein ACI9CF_000401 [Candidatus Omnitrophota bacterium]|jgi:hypothetical protein